MATVSSSEDELEYEVVGGNGGQGELGLDVERAQQRKISKQRTPTEKVKLTVR